ncbi:unnamed protein product [Rotaria socialis]|uniref:Riboflavin transporter n=1 Tax=Rotaria socialis TaxID=392032 RepID=A0A817TNP6_9BILA|nr:unnamed protein product [Rotaria socialis]CAF3347184.1 unnamed protein product [Rotaria socialis]CAF3678143.1 unnamed protein product [Rotaria socialis]CAF3706230.1 unnamed protein product [Rotaria socialis]CAF4182962.1 unnamed protein product [Rotaria socialis]
MWAKLQLKTIFVSTLVALFVVGSWLNLCGVWIEFPLMVNRLPEKWALPATMGLVSNLANIGVIIIALIRRLSRGGVTYEIPVNICILTTGTIVLIVLAFVWHKTTTINGSPHSSYLMGFSLTLALVDCTSSVTFLPFLDRYEPIYMNAYFIGEALSNLLPALLGIAQGVGKTSCIDDGNGTLTPYDTPPRFSVQTYFLALSVIMLGSLLSFVTLCVIRMGRKQEKNSIDFSHTKNDSPVVELSTVEKTATNLEPVELKGPLESENRMTRKEFWISEHGIYLFLCFWTSILIIGATPSIQSYSLYPYSIEVYHYTIIACQFAYPLMSLLGVFVPKLPSRYLYVLTVIGTGLFGYTFLAAKLSPCSPLVDQFIGKLVISTSWFLKYCILFFIRILVGNYFRHKSGHRGLFWFGFLTQIGSLIGAVVIYLFTDHLKLFEQREVCLSYSC